MLLVAGGERDPNLRAVIDAATTAGLDAFPLMVGGGRPPSASWDLEAGELHVEGEPLQPTAAFVRYDVFGPSGRGARQRAPAWHELVQAWLASSPEVRVLNRAHIGRRALKLEVLVLARALGLRVPATLATNDMPRVEAFRGPAEGVAKPVAGGGYCRLLADLQDDTELRGGVAACPAIVQERIRGADVRIYAVGGECLGFRIDSRGLDYRAAGAWRIDGPLDLPEGATDALARLMAALGLEWGAADYKLEEDSGELVFLEINSNPMFSAFDAVVDGRISASIVRRLAEPVP